MTIAAIVRGRQGTYNALFVDTGAVRSDGVVADHDKLHRVFGDTYTTCVGDASLLVVLSNLVRTSRTRPNLRDPKVIGALMSEVELARRNGALLGVPTAFPAPPRCTTLVVCNRSEAFFLKMEFNTEAGTHVIPVAPAFLEPDAMLVLRGVTVATIEGFFTVEQTTVEQVVVDQMVGVNEQLERGGADRLPYQMKRRVSGIILPHKTSSEATRIDPGVPPMPIHGISID
ncbi:MAG TPA: hypothetical protein VGI10_26255 [Polyangiaceae bacterium]|jgi:hypothetical protein